MTVKSTVAFSSLEGGDWSCPVICVFPRHSSHLWAESGGFSRKPAWEEGRTLPACFQIESGLNAAQDL